MLLGCYSLGLIYLDHEGQTSHVKVETVAGVVEILCDYRVVAKRLILEGAHIQAFSLVLWVVLG